MGPLGEQTKDVRFGPKVVRLAATGTNRAFFKIIFQYILVRRAKMYQNRILKVLDLSHLELIWPTFGPTLTSLEATGAINQ